METNQSESTLSPTSESMSTTTVGEHKLDVNMKKSPCSPSPPLLLLPETDEKSDDEDDLENDDAEIDVVSNESNVTSSGDTSSLSSLSSKENNSLVLIETKDSSEISLILSFIKANFPNLNVQVTSRNQDNSMPTASPQSQSPSLKANNTTTTTTTTTPTTSSRNCLSATYFVVNGDAAMRKSSSPSSSDRASSIDNSSLSSNSSSIDRQESKDSGFWSMSKNSFESMKSLSINDTVMHGDQTHSTHSKPFAPTTLQIQKIEPFKKQQQQQSHSPQQQHQQYQQQTPQQHTLANQNTNNMTLNQISSGLNEVDNGSGSGSVEVSKYLISPTNVSNTKTSLLGWKKWKKGQTWRYNSSSNVSESENTNDTTYTNDSSRPNSQNSSFAINKSTDSDTLSVNSENSYFKCGKDECPSESACQNGGLKVSTPNPILIQTNVAHFSNSFDSTKTSYITIPQPGLNNWSSTSKLDDSSISGIFFVLNIFNLNSGRRRY